jgi:hypothetical protein
LISSWADSQAVQGVQVVPAALPEELAELQEVQEVLRISLVAVLRVLLVEPELELELTNLPVF